MMSICHRLSKYRAILRKRTIVIIHIKEDRNLVHLKRSISSYVTSVAIWGATTALVTPTGETTAGNHPQNSEKTALAVKTGS